MGLIFRVLLGYLIACLVAGLTTVLFAWTPADLSAMQGDAANDKLALAMPVATHFALFALPFALAAFAYGEARRRHDWLYYTLAGVAIALVGFASQYINEHASPAWSIMSSNYPLFAFITSGFMGGLAYWIFSGRLAGIRPGQQQRPMTSGRPGGSAEMSGKSTTTAGRPTPHRS